MRARDQGSRRAALAPLAGVLLVPAALLAPLARAQGPAGPPQPQGPSRPAQPQSPASALTQMLDRQRMPMSPEMMRRAPAVLKLPGEARVVVRRDLVYHTVNARALRYDLYLPSEPRAGLLPVIVFASGATDARGWGVYASYGRLAAAQDFAGIVYEKRFERSEVLDGVADTEALLEHLRERGRELGLDASRVVLWGFSGGGLLLGAGIHGTRSEVRALIGFYPALDLGNTLPYYPDSLRAVARARASPADMLEARPLALPPTLIARAGLDDPMLQSALLRFVRLALEANRPIELLNLPEGRHGFDFLDDNEESRRVIRRAFAFAKEHTAAAPKTP